MITSSLPPELKVIIAGAVMLGGCLLALRFPADREEPSSVATNPAVAESNTHVSSSAAASDQATYGAPGDGVPRFESVDEFISRTDDPSRSRIGSSGSVASDTTRSGPISLSHSPGWSSTTMSTRASIPATPDTGSTDMPADLSPTTYANIPLNDIDVSAAASEAHAVPRPTYEPFRRTQPVTMPEPNPAFFSEHPSPPNLAPLSAPSQSSVEAQPIVAPSAVAVPHYGTTSVSPTTPQPVTAARPVTPIAVPPITTSPVTSPTTGATPATAVPIPRSSSYPATTAPSFPSAQGDVIIAPVRTIISPR